MKLVGKFQPVRGTKDLLFDEVYKFQYIQNVAQEIGSRYGFLPVETPIFEFSDVFYKTLGDTSDIITKEMYIFSDRNGESITLRPEFTASVVRLLINNNLNLPARIFTSGPVFRYERPQKCRQRQFHQINYEFFGIDSYIADVDIICLAYNILDTFNLCEKVILEINSLGSREVIDLYKCSLVKYFTKYKNDLSEDSKRRLTVNPLRILDSKNEQDIDILKDAPVITNFYNKYSQQFFDNILEKLSKVNIKYKVNTRLVRGLDYYCHTVFEFTTECLGSQSAVIAGGRYDDLVSNMGGNNTPAVGFAGGIERIASLMSYSREEHNVIALVPIGENAKNYAIDLAYKLRCQGMKVLWNYDDSLKYGLKQANKLNAKVALIFGDKEMISNYVIVKNMNTGEQREVNVNELFLAESLLYNI
ncbi:histidine--tRNA ligase [Neoehrlichia mikurensis]|uniref:Histidine--tRNA ligase n=1 Tax=Neoehrlichia mikurensis TaxID=89586 RepID=A0A9Q9BTZ7_9RICK|nr:histidine--tRNA ligase [Neoehrlichia mikurensis]QXK92399.1 histidine--tRNA ligase [Neoehrlichia mikurensis]QXK93246.1 histidine--tRNA ligase [Neoehrlichia mikurensis]QXK94090.1 histidine--tRNA ligase [Neoehrlichia mikurensis]UTO55917.1 histidine--tRNA ligase [Neoehrlichia mikurensis]UTO56834.1 histidine--tRNA ligase [Neoehrlichia mikurensis]